ncbi:Bgt-51610 [Blumeria graminis f. sp. tritici]|uniref:Bgt-51610 n=1 Tax=Blumeria graminis f. sp. tritici TaxID=62690 RepID=A0A9X9MNN9_BLUGR|nr:Bgt-51610 [Blumeria graminis f. sp. tritici]
MIVDATKYRITTPVYSSSSYRIRLKTHDDV